MTSSTPVNQLVCQEPLDLVLPSDGDDNSARGHNSMCEGYPEEGGEEESDFEPDEVVEVTDYWVEPCKTTSQRLSSDASLRPV